MRLSELAEGQELPSREFGPITRTDIVRYQGASGDFNPIHHDEPFAREAGYESVISVGMLQAGYVGTYCVDLFGPESVRELLVRFKDTIAPGDMVTCGGRVSSVEEVAGRDCQVTIELQMQRGAEVCVLTGRATIVSGGSPRN
ncbi:MAG: MaoC/PaaZ C-terminal domain-containing protein [Actinomycetota bacterium]